MLLGPCSRCSGLATFGSFDQPRKRRKVDQSEQTGQIFQPLYDETEWPINSSLVTTTQSNLTSAPLVPTGWPNMAPSLPMKSPLTRRIMEWGSFLCPCCGQSQFEGMIWNPCTLQSVVNLSIYIHSLTVHQGYQLVNNAQEVLYPSAEPYLTEKAPDCSAPQQTTPMFSECNIQDNVQHQSQVQTTGYHDFDTTTVTSMAAQSTQPVPLFPAVNHLYTQEWQERRLSDNSTIGCGSLTDSMTLSPSPNGLGGTTFGMFPQQLLNGAMSQTSTSSGDTAAVEVEVSYPETTMSEWRTIPSNNSAYGLDMVILPGPRSGKRGPFKDLALREQTAQTRKIGSCVRCRMQRIRVSNSQVFVRISC